MIKEPALYNEVNDYINSLNVEVKSFDENESGKYPAPAFVMKRFNNCVPYKVFYKNDDFEKYYLLHEYGHIYFAHINNEVLKENLIKSRLKYILPKEVSEEDFMRVFSMHIDNVTKDMEVNSKLFSDEEFEAFEKGTGHEYILPQRYGFPKGLEADTYLNLILMDLNKFMDDDKSRQQRKNDDNKDDQSNKSNGSGNSKGGSSSMSTEDYIDSIKKELEETSSVNENFESRVKQGDKDEAGESGNKAGEGKQYKTKDEDINIESDNDLKAFIKGIHTKKTKVVKKVDVMYNYNRRKTGSSVIIPKISSSYKKKDEKATLYILYDVSGSVDSVLTEKIVKSIKEICNELKTGSRVIFWNESLVNDIDIKDIGNIYCGGGTYMASGVVYIEQQYHPKSNDYVLIVSDFEDNIPLIGKFMNKIVAKKAALLWYSDYSDKGIKDEILKNIYDVKLAMFNKI